MPPQNQPHLLQKDGLLISGDDVITVSSVYLGEDDGGTRVVSDLGEDDGGTRLVSDLGEDDGGTRVVSDLGEDDGGTRVVSDLGEDDGGTRVVSDLGEDDGGTRLVSDLGEDDGGTRLVSDLGEDDGGTRLVSDLGEDDGGTRLVSDLASKINTQISPSKIMTATQPSVIQVTQKQSKITDTQPSLASQTTHRGSLLQPGQLLAQRYQVNKILGRGGFGAAYLAEDVRLRRLCVVKQMLVPANRTAKQIEQLRASFEQEANLLAQLNQPGHPNIPEIYDYFFDESGNYLVMKYIQGKDLNDVIKQAEGKLPWRETIRYMIAVCDALSYMHTQGNQPVLHRDVKPGNILLGNDGRLWLVDFGLAMEGVASAGATEGSGSPGYTPLEQWLGKAISASDVYAAGVTLHYLVTSINPLEAYGGKVTVPKLKELHGKLPSLDKIETLDKTIPKELNSIIAAAIAVEPQDRPTANQLKQELQLLISGAQSAALFTFKNGISAVTVDQLVDLCEQNQAEARGYLYNGDFERWFSLINRNDLAEAAHQAVKQYPQKQKQGLERFLKLARPGLFWRRVRIAGLTLARWSATFLLALCLVLILVTVGGAYSSRLLIRWGIATYPWSFYTLKTNEPNIFTESYLSENLALLTNTILTEPHVDVVTPDQVKLEGQLGNYQVSVPLTLQLQGQKPFLKFGTDNQWVEYFITDNIVQGINEGISDAFRTSPVDITDLRVNNQAITFTVKLNGQVALATPTPGPTATPTPLPTPTMTATPDGPALIVIYNDVGHDIILQLDGETWNMPTNGTQLVEKPPGVYSYTVLYRANGQLAAQGSKDWKVKAYRWHIEVADLNATPPADKN